MTLRDLSPDHAWELIGTSLGVAARSPEALLAELDPRDISREPWIVTF